MEQNSREIKIADLLCGLFLNSEHFSKEEYYKMMISICPELKEDDEKNIPSVQEIEQMIIKEFAGQKISGKTSVPELERALNISIDPQYKYPDGKDDLEYELSLFYKYGLYDVRAAKDWRKYCFFPHYNESYELCYKEKPIKSRAYLASWCCLHYKDDEVKKFLQGDWDELCQLNSELKGISFDREDAELLRVAIDGVIYGFRVADIQLFLEDCKNGLVAKKHEERIRREWAHYGLPKDVNPCFVVSSETMALIGKEYKKEKLRNEKQQYLVSVSRSKEKETNGKNVCISCSGSKEAFDLINSGYLDDCLFLSKKRSSRDD